MDETYRISYRWEPESPRRVVDLALSIVRQKLSGEYEDFDEDK